MFSSPDPFPPYPLPRKLACVDWSELPVGLSQPEAPAGQLQPGGQSPGLPPPTCCPLLSTLIICVFLPTAISCNWTNSHSSLTKFRAHLLSLPFQLKRAKWKSEVAQSCLTLWDPVDCSPPGSSVHGIPQARILEWVAISFSKGSSRPRDQTQVSRVEADALTSEPPGKPRVPSNTNPEKLHYPLWSSLSPTCTFVNCSFIQFSWILFKSVTQFECAITFLGKTLAHTVPFGVSYSYCFPSGTVVKNPFASAGHARDTCSNPLSGEDPLE